MAAVDRSLNHRPELAREDVLAAARYPLVHALTPENAVQAREGADAERSWGARIGSALTRTNLLDERGGCFVQVTGR